MYSTAMARKTCLLLPILCYILQTKALSCGEKEFGMLTRRDHVLGNQPVVLLRKRPTQTGRRRGLGMYCLLVLVLGFAQASLAQVLSPPPQLEATAIALEQLQNCGKAIASKASKISSNILDAHDDLYAGLLRGGYTGGSATGGAGYNRKGGYDRGGGWLKVPPPKEYVADLSHEARWCLQVANILNTDPERKEASEKVLASIAEDLRIKAADCRAWGAGRLITVIASTLRNGQPDPGWTVMYKWVSVSGLSSIDLSFPQISTPTSKALPPGVYAVYAEKQVGDTLKKTASITVSAFQEQKVKCEIPVP
jgi:hypothetical protein